MQKLLAAAITLCVVGGLLMIVTITLRASTGGQVSIDYGIILDAGSSHTEVFLYKWRGDQINNTGVVEEKTSCSTHLGIDDNEDNVTETLKDLMSCVKNVTSKIEFGEEDPVPIYLGATAGMRLLEKTKPDISRIIFLSIENALLRYRDEGKLFQVQKVGLLTGQQEAVSAWISANYLNNVFPNLAAADTKHKSSVGILEMGGASAQIAYEVKDNGTYSDQEVSSVRLYGKTYKIRAESQLCFGANELMTRHLYMAAKEAGSSKIDDPCLFDGFERNFSGSELLTPCTETGKQQVIQRAETYTFKGKYDKVKCEALMNAMTTASKCKEEFKICFEEEKFGPPTDMKFYGVANYYRTTEPLRKKYKKTNFTQQEFEQGIDHFCSSKYGQLEQSGKLSMKYAWRYCAMLQFFAATFRNLFKMDAAVIPNINFVNKIGPDSIKWATGFMMNATNLIPPEMPSSSIISVPLLVVLLIVSAILIVGGLGVAGAWRKREQTVVVNSAKEHHALNPRNNRDPMA